MARVLMRGIRGRDAVGHRVHEESSGATAEDESAAERVLRTPSLLAAFAAEYRGPDDPRDVLLRVARPGGAAAGGAIAADLAAARAALYRRDVTETDRGRFREQVERAQQDELAVRTALERVVAARAASIAGRRRASLRLSVVLGAAVVVGAAVAGALAPGPSASTPAPTGTPSSTGLELRRVPDGWELSSLVRRGDGLANGASLTINRSVTGGEFLLLVRCPAQDRRFRIDLMEDGEQVGGPWSGACGPQASVPLPLERGVGRVEVVITTAGDEPFAAAVVRRGSGGR